MLVPLRQLPSLLIMGGADEYVPDHEAYQALGVRLQGVIGANATVVTIEGGDHNLEGKEGELVGQVLEFMGRHMLL